ncbi:response regulator [Cohnella sp. GCM10027633]|uniref:response regulator n=1 Tax=unclassified Cohnella TaxID=2636738 RepID=UPI0036431E71
MLRIAIADDEEFIRNGLKDMIRNLNRGYEVVADASNGEQVMDYLLTAETLPDLLITDIKMPVMDGRELVRQLTRRYPQIEKLVLSGYDDFELVRESFKSGAFDYLVKPIDSVKLAYLLRQAEERHQSAKQSNELKIHEQIRLNESLPLLKEQVLWRLLQSGGSTGDPLTGKYEHYRIDFGQPPYRVVLIAVHNYKALVKSIGEPNAQIHAFIVRNVVQNTMPDGFGYELFAKDGVIAVIIGQAEGAGFSDALRKIETNLKQYAKVGFSIGVGRIACGVTEFKRSYEEALQLLEHRFYRGESGIIEDEEARRKFGGSHWADLTDNYLFRLLDGIEKGKTQSIRELFRTIEEKIRAQYAHPSLAVQLFAELYTRLNVEHEQMRALFAELFGQGYDYVQALLDYDTLDELARYSMQAYEQAARRRASVLLNKEKRWIDEAKKIIIAHLSDELTLQRVAGDLYLNPNYLSDLFRKETGETFVDFLTRKRMEKAKELLKSTRGKSYEVAEQVGYKDADYFSKVFKKIVGMSPSDYRNRMT